MFGTERIMIPSTGLQFLDWGVQEWSTSNSNVKRLEVWARHLEVAAHACFRGHHRDFPRRDQFDFNDMFCGIPQ